MTPELEKYYEDRFAMMATPGWSDLMEDIRLMRATTNDLAAVRDTEALFFKKGELSIMDWLLSIQSVSEQSYEDLKGENATTA